jgi:hypothetical protein
MDEYPLVSSHIAMENHHLYIIGKSTISMGQLFNSYFDIKPEGNIWKIAIEPS